MTAFVDTNQAFHTYRIEVGSPGDIVVFYDGAPTLSGSTYSDHQERRARDAG
jgi:hypothetical protein